jgi:hypothetical protein
MPARDIQKDKERLLMEHMGIFPHAIKEYAETQPKVYKAKKNLLE